jgi:hypothetical protein
LFSELVSAATANRTIGVLTDRELVIEQLGEAMRVARERKAGGAPPAVAVATAAEQDEPLRV